MKLSIPVGQLAAEKLEDGISAAVEHVSAAVRGKWGDSVVLENVEKQYEVTATDKEVALKFLSQTIRKREDSTRGVNIDLKWSRRNPEFLIIKVYERSQLDDRLESAAYVFSIAVAVLVVVLKFSVFGKNAGQFIGVLIFVPTLIACYIANWIIHSFMKNASSELMRDAEQIIAERMLGRTTSAKS